MHAFVSSYLCRPEAASALIAAGIPTQAVPCNLSQVQSVHACLEALLKLQMGPVQQLIKALPATAAQQKVHTHSRAAIVYGILPASCKFMTMLHIYNLQLCPKPVICPFANADSVLCVCRAQRLQMGKAGSSKSVHSAT